MSKNYSEDLKWKRNLYEEKKNMRIKVASFRRSEYSKDTAIIVLYLKDDQENLIAQWEGYYKKKDNSYAIIDYLGKELFVNSLIDWNDLSEDVENRLLAFDLEHNIDIK